MLAFGIDPGSRRTGWGAVRIDGSALAFVGAEVIRLDERAPLADRLAALFEGLERELGAHVPDQVFLESVFHQKSAQSALVLGQARGVALLAAARSGRLVGEVSPAEVKKAVTGSGRASKEQVQEMTRVLLGLSATVPSDAADALAVAIAGSAAAKWAETRAQLGVPEAKAGGRKRGWRRRSGGCGARSSSGARPRSWWTWAGSGTS